VLEYDEVMNIISRVMNINGIPLPASFERPIVLHVRPNIELFEKSNSAVYGLAASVWTNEITSASDSHQRFALRTV